MESPPHHTSGNLASNGGVCDGVLVYTDKIGLCYVLEVNEVSHMRRTVAQRAVLDRGPYPITLLYGLSVGYFVWFGVINAN